MKGRYKAVAALLLVMLQLFCMLVPSLAADETTATTQEGGEWVEKSFYQTKITEDFRKTEAELLSLYPMDSTDGRSAELISAVTEFDEYGEPSMFLYIYVPIGTDECVGGSAATCDIQYANTWVGKFKMIDSTDTLLKVRVSFSEASFSKYFSALSDRYEFFVTSFMLMWRVDLTGEVVEITYDAVTRELDGGKLTSELLLTMNKDGKPTSWMVEETLKLDVHLSSERYSTPENGKFTQLNTAIFVVPNEYFYDDTGKYLTLSEIVYQYELYQSVPMFVYDSDTFEAIDYNSIYRFGRFYTSPSGLSNSLLDTHLPPVEDFAFHVEEIGELEDADYDVSTEQALEAYASARETYHVNQFYRQYHFWEYIKASEYTELQTIKRKASEIIKTDSYANGAEWWQKLFDGRLFGKNHDDSVKVNAIQTITKAALQAKTDEALMDEYAISEHGVEDLRAVMNVVDGNLYIGVVFHYLETPYEVFDITGYNYREGGFPSTMPGKAYIAHNSIIDKFRIIQLHFGQNDQIKIVPTVMPTLTYVEGLEGPDKLEDETFDPWRFGDWWIKVKEFFRTVFIIVIAIVVVVVVFNVLRLIGVLRDAFGRRGGGKGGGG